MRPAFVMAACLALAACFADDDPDAATDAQSCDTYCALAVSYCKHGNIIFVDPQTCPTTCTGFDITGGVGDNAGDTLQCRLTYLFAARKEPVAFCRDAAPNSLACQ